MKFKIAVGAFLFLFFADLRPARAEEIGGMPVSVTNLATVGTAPYAQYNGETVKEFDSRLSSTVGILSDQLEMGNLDPDQYAMDINIINGIMDTEGQIKEKQGGFIANDQLDRSDLEQVDEQLDQISFN